MKLNFAGCAMMGLLLTTLAGCASFDEHFYAVDDAIMKGDFRALGKSQPATLAQICKDWYANEINAKKKWESALLAIPAVVERVSKSKSSISTEFAVAFRDVAKNGHSAVAFTRNANSSNEDKISTLKTGDKIVIVGVLNADASSSYGQDCSFRFDKAMFRPFGTKAALK